MTCDRARELMLTAELSELHGSDTSAFSRHLAACERCRTIAAALLTGQRELSDALFAFTTPSAQPARAALRAAQQRRVRMRTMRWMAPLAVAAGLATVLVTRTGSPPFAESPAPRPEAALQGVSVTAPPGRSVAVLQTEHSNIVVIWFY